MGKLKYEIRRESDSKVKLEKLEKAFKTIGGEASASKTNPRGLSELLVIRSKEFLRNQVARALQDAQTAVALAADFAQAQLALGSALEMSGRAAEGALALKTALEIDKGINKAAVKRQMNRLERKAKEQADNPQEAAVAVAPPPVVPEPPPQVAPAPKPKVAPKKKAVAKKKASSGDGAKGAKKATGDAEKHASKKVAEKPVEAPKVEEAIHVSTPRSARADSEGGMDFVEWRLEETSKLNHNCIRMLLKSTNIRLTSKHPVSDVWHVDFLREMDFGEELKRAYTPVSDKEAYRNGVLEFMIKVYPDGKMTPYLESLRPGSTLLVSPPAPTLRVEDYEDIVMIAGGSAVTVALQICRAFFASRPSASIQLAMCNRTLKDVLYQNLFDELLGKHSSFRMTNCISSGDVMGSPAEEGIAGLHSGRISSDVFPSGVPGNCKGIVSGPMGLCQAAVGIWAKLGRDPTFLNILDELPPPKEEADSPDSKAAESASTPRGQVDYPESLTINPKVLEEEAGDQRTRLPAPDEVEAPPPVRSGFFGGLLSPFLCCQAKRLDPDDGEGIPTIGTA
mmetsp:Transcript_63802/g.113218  ORF Transcript_63802/g.113218 Transcript_63802/m.113218 type:complete len:566 (+) Transcript_63802:233-1930(+)